MARDEAAREVAEQSAGYARFRAFVSYSHADAAAARRLQKRLETYRVPKRLAGRVAPIGASSGRVGPVFRDREDLPASADLSEAVKDALAGSRALIVLCSPDAARSLWVAREIELFRAIHPDRPVLAALIRGTPDEAFPAELRKDGAEPLAADFRRSGDGRRLAFLKVVAGILGIPLDELIQRDGQRRQRRVMAVTVAAVAAMLVLATITIFALVTRGEAERQRAEAERQRAEAEGLIEFMLTDLRQVLKTVGRLDVMDNVNRRALAYYENQGSPERLSDNSLERRARVVRTIGEDDEVRQKYDRALQGYRTYFETTRALLAKRPNDPARILAHAESENRIGSLAFLRKDFAGAYPWFRRSSRRIASIAAWGRRRADWLRLAAFAEGNTCATLLKLEKAREALPYCSHAVFHNDGLGVLQPQTASYDRVLQLLWLSEAQLAAGQTGPAQQTQARYLALMRTLVSGSRDNKALLEEQMQLYTRHSELLSLYKLPADPRPFRDTARAISEELHALDPNNAEWLAYRNRLAVPASKESRK
jgi:hypothetical protein